MSKSINKLKCKGGKVKKMQEGGFFENLAGKLFKNKDKEDALKSLNSLSSGVFDVAGSALSAIPGAEAPNESINPADYLQKADSQAVAKNIAGSTLGGAAKGMVTAGPIGAAIGGGLGLLKSGITSLIGSKARRKEREKAILNWSNKWNDQYANALEEYSYKSGGISTGKAKKILREKNPTLQGHPITEAQRRWLGWIAGGRKADGGEVIDYLKHGGLSRDKDYGSKEKPYPKVKSKDFAGKKRSYPIPTKADAVDALKLAGLHGRSDVRSKVYKKYPDLKKKAGGGVIQTKEGASPVAPGEILGDSAAQQQAAANKKGDIYQTPTYSELTKRYGTYMATSSKRAGAQVTQKGYYLEGKTPKGEFHSYTPQEVGLYFPNIDFKKLPVLKKGGIIKGEGGPKDDRISMKAEEGSFIVPAENTERAKELGKLYLGWDGDEKAKKGGKGTRIKVSNNEVIFTPEEVDILKYHGVDLDDLAPNAEPENKAMQDGGYPYEDESEQGLASLKKEEKKKEKEEKKSALDIVFDLAPEIAGAAQVGAASIGFQRAGEMPSIHVSDALKQINSELNKQRQYGLEPGAKSVMKTDAEKARRDAMKVIVQRGGSAQEIMSNLQGILSTTIDRKNQIEIEDSRERARKMSAYVQGKMTEAGQQFDISKIAREDWLRLQEVNAGLLSAGISNIIGARKLKKEMEAMKQIRDQNKIVFNLSQPQS